MIKKLSENVPYSITGIVKKINEMIDKINSSPSDNNDFKKVCSKCGEELSEYAIEKDICNRCSVGMPISKPIKS